MRRPDLESLRRYAANDGRWQIVWHASTARFSCCDADRAGMGLALIFMAVFGAIVTTSTRLVYDGAIDWGLLFGFGVAPLALGVSLYFASNQWAIVVTPGGLEWHRPLAPIQRASWHEIQWREIRMPRATRINLRVRGREQPLWNTRAPLYLQSLIRERATEFSGPPLPSST